MELRSSMFWMAVTILILQVIIAVGNWQLYGRVSNVETILGLRATPQ